jgi:hypothetical protein
MHAFDFSVLAGLAWDPHIKGVLIVLAAVGILMGSIYLILYTNIGSRLGFLLALGGFFGWLAILGLTWWINPPAIGPRGSLPQWEPVEIVYGDLTNPSNGAQNAEARTLPNVCWSVPSTTCPQDTTEADQLIAEHPDLFTDIDANPTLSELEALDTEGVIDQEVDFGDWTLTSSADAGEADSSASAILTEAGVFQEVTDFIVLDTFELGGKASLPDNPSRIDHITTWFKKTFDFFPDEHYAIVQVQQVAPAELVPGEPPPVPQADPNAPLISVVMVRSHPFGGLFGSKRVPPALVTLGSLVMLGVIASVLHRRDKLAESHFAEASSNGG